MVVLYAEDFIPRVRDVSDKEAREREEKDDISKLEAKFVDAQMNAGV